MAAFVLVAWVVLAGDAGARLEAPDARDRVAPALRLADLGPFAVPVLTRALGHTNPDVRRHAAWALGQSKAGNLAVRELAALLGDESPLVRDEAADALASIGPAAKDALRAALKSKDATVRAAALRAFGATGPRRGGVALPATYVPRGLHPVGEPSFVGPDLSDALRDPDIAVRWAAVAHVWGASNSRHFPDIKDDALPGLKALLFDPNAQLRADADGLLRRFGENPDALRAARQRETQRALTLLEVGAAGALPGTRAVVAVAQLDAARRAARREFIAAFQFARDRPARGTNFPQAKQFLDITTATDPLTAHMIAYLLIGSSDDPRIPALMLAGLSSADAGVRHEAALALPQLHTAATVPAPVLARLRECAEDPLARVRAAVFDARLALLAPGDEFAAAVLARLSDANPQTRLRALQTTERVGAAALPALAKMVSDPDPELRRLGHMFYTGVIGALPNPTPAQIAAALDGLLAALADPAANVRAEAAWRLATLNGSNYAHFGPHAMTTELRDKLFAAHVELVRADPERVIRVRAVQSLKTFGPRAADVLLPLLNDPVVGPSVAQVGYALGPRGAECVPALVKMLKGDARARGGAIFPLEQLGPLAKDALPDLVALAADQDARASGVIRALVSIDPEGKQAIPAILKALEGKAENTYDRDQLFFALVSYGPKAAGAVPLLKEQMKLGVTAYTATLAAVIGPKAEPLVPVLVAALNDPAPNRPASDEALARALAAIGVKSDDVVKALRARLPGVNGRANVPVALALVALADDKDAHEIVTKALDPKSPLCAWAVVTLRFFPTVWAKYAPHLHALAEADSEHRLPAIRELAARGEGRKYVPYLIDRIKEKGFEYGLCVTVLGLIGPDAADAVPVLRALLPRVPYESNARDVEAAIAAITAKRK